MTDHVERELFEESWAPAIAHMTPCPHVDERAEQTVAKAVCCADGRRMLRDGPDELPRFTTWLASEREANRAT